MIMNHPYTNTTTVYSPFESLVGQMLCDPPVCTSGLPGATDSKESACNRGDPSSVPGSGRSLEREMVTHSRILAWKILWIEQPDKL